MNIKKYIQIIPLFLIIFLFSGCQDNNIEAYNEVSKEHQDVVNEAFLALNNSISYYNNQEYDKALSSAQECQNLFTQSKDLSQQSKDLAENINGKEWLIEYKNYAIKSEQLRIDQCKLLGQVSTSTKNKDTEAAQNQLSEISKINDEYDKIQLTMEDIKSQHPESFQN